VDIQRSVFTNVDAEKEISHGFLQPITYIWISLVCKGLTLACQPQFQEKDMDTLVSAHQFSPLYPAL
jgi:hypothetical protein